MSNCPGNIRFAAQSWPKSGKVRIADGHRACARHIRIPEGTDGSRLAEHAYSRFLCRMRLRWFQFDGHSNCSIYQLESSKYCMDANISQSFGHILTVETG